MSKPSTASQPLAVEPVDLAASAINSVLGALPARTADFISIVLITRFTGQAVHQQRSLVRAALPYVQQLRWGWHRVERVMARGTVGLEGLFERAVPWGLACLPAEPVRVGSEQRTVQAFDSSTVVRLWANPKRGALPGKGYCQCAQRAGPANFVAALTTVVLSCGIQVGMGLHTRLGVACQEAVAQVFTALPESLQTRLFRGDAGSAPVEQFRAVTEHNALVGRLRKNVTLHRAPAPLRPGPRGRPVLHKASLHEPIGK